MHTSTAALATVALVATGLPLALTAPVGTPDSNLETHESSAMDLGSFSAFQSPNLAQATEIMSKRLAPCREPIKTNKSALFVLLTAEDKAELEDFLARSSQGSTITIQDMTFEIKDSKVMVDHAQYDIFGVLDPSKRSSSREQDLDSGGIRVSQARDESSVLRTRARKSPIPSKTTKPQLRFSLSGKDKAVLDRFVRAQVEGSTLELKGLTFTFQNNTVKIGSDTREVYTLSAIQKLLKRQSNFSRNLDAFQACDDLTELQISATKSPMRHSIDNGMPIKVTEPSLPASLSSDDKAQLQAFLKTAIKGSITIAGLTFTYEDGLVSISSDQDSASVI